MSSFITKLTVLFLLTGLLNNNSAKAQIEVAHLFSKGLSANGLGAYLHIGVPVSEADEVSIEGGFYYLGHKDTHIAMVPLLAGYRHTLDGSGTRFYIEPVAGYNIGGTDIQKYDANGSPLVTPDGNELDQKVSGITAGLGFGYIIPSDNWGFNFGLRYQHIFVTQNGDPGQNLLSFRISYPFRIGRRE